MRFNDAQKCGLKVILELAEVGRKKAPELSLGSGMHWGSKGQRTCILGFAAIGAGANWYAPNWARTDPYRAVMDAMLEACPALKWIQADAVVRTTYSINDEVFDLGPEPVGSYETVIERLKEELE